MSPEKVSLAAWTVVSTVAQMKAVPCRLLSSCALRREPRVSTACRQTQMHLPTDQVADIKVQPEYQPCDETAH